MKTFLLAHKVMNRLIRHYMISSVSVSGRSVFLTFDDGPEPEITEFVLKELEKYGFSATFFCRGDNAEKYPELLRSIADRGHTIANHSYSHLHAYETSNVAYVSDVCKCDATLKTRLFRPPYGSLTLLSWLRLKKKYSIYFWSLTSGDSDMENFDYDRSLDNLKRTKPGDIVLFHFCGKHKTETQKILPVYLNWLKNTGFVAEKL